MLCFVDYIEIHNDLYFIFGIKEKFNRKKEKRRKKPPTKILTKQNGTFIFIAAFNQKERPKEGIETKAENVKQMKITKIGSRKLFLSQ